MNKRKSSGFTLVELLVVISIIGVLAGLLLPAIQSARESARSAKCRSNLRQIAIATELFQNTFGAYPPARFQPVPGDYPEVTCGGSETTWLARIMPFLEQATAGQQWNFSNSYASHSERVRRFNLAVYCCPSRRTVDTAYGEGISVGDTTLWHRLPCGCMIPYTVSASQSVRGAVGDYGGNHGDLSPGSAGLATDFYYGGNGTGVLISSRARCVDGKPTDWVDKVKHADVTDGLSNTLLIGEMHVPVGKLRQPGIDAFIFNGDHVFNSTRVGGPTVPITQNPRDELTGLVAWGSWHFGSCSFAVCDGSIRSISNSIDTETLGYLCNRRDNSAFSQDD